MGLFTFTMRFFGQGVRNIKTWRMKAGPTSIDEQGTQWLNPVNSMHAHPTMDALAPVLARQIGAWMQGILASQSSVAVALAGGTTPSPVYEALATLDLPWERCTLFMGDDRNVAVGSERCNLTMAKRCFADVGVNWLDLRHEPVPSPDIAVFGWGLDGHTASWFPDLERPVLDDLFSTEANTMTVAPPSQGEARTTLTWSALGSTRRFVLLGKGEAKKAVLDAASEKDDSYTHPLRQLFAHPRVVPEVWWSAE
jgi:6-phosphogluconolactonase